MRPVVMGLLLPRHSKNLTKPLLLNSSVQWLSHVRLSAIPWTTAHQPSLSITNSRSLFKLMPVELVMPSNYFILCRPLFLLTSIFPTISIFSDHSVVRLDVNYREKNFKKHKHMQAKQYTSE